LTPLTPLPDKVGWGELAARAYLILGGSRRMMNLAVATE